MCYRCLGYHLLAPADLFPSWRRRKGIQRESPQTSTNFPSRSEQLFSISLGSCSSRVAIAKARSPAYRARLISAAVTPRVQAVCKEGVVNVGENDTNCELARIKYAKVSQAGHKVDGRASVDHGSLNWNLFGATPSRCSGFNGRLLFSSSFLRWNCTLSSPAPTNRFPSTCLCCEMLVLTWCSNRRTCLLGPGNSHPWLLQWNVSIKLSSKWFLLDICSLEGFIGKLVLYCFSIRVRNIQCFHRSNPF